MALCGRTLREDATRGSALAADADAAGLFRAGEKDSAAIPAGYRSGSARAQEAARVLLLSGSRGYAAHGNGCALELGVRAHERSASSYDLQRLTRRDFDRSA